MAAGSPYLSRGWYDTVSWDEVKEGDVLPEIRMLITYRKVVQTVLAARDFYPGHHNPEYARAQGIENIYLQTNFFQGFMDRVVTDAFGPGVFIKRRRMRMRSPVTPGTTLIAGGKVTRKYVQNGERLVDVEVVIRKENNVTACEGSVTVAFKK